MGVLLCHGFTGSPASLRPWADSLAVAGYRVAAPRLPGHGTHWRQLNLTRWQDWYARVEQEFNILRRECQQVFVGGLSMGGSLALRLAARYGADVAGLLLVNPAVSSHEAKMRLLPLLAKVVPSVGGITNDIAQGGDEHGYPRTPLRAAASMLQLWSDVAAQLPRVTQPVLLLTSTVDHVIDRSSTKTILTGVSSTDVTQVALPNSYHVATLDFDAPLIFDRSVEFLTQHRLDRTESAP